MNGKTSFWHKVSNQSLPLHQKAIHLILATWSEMLLTIVAISAVLSTQFFPTTDTDTLSSYLLYVFTLGVSSAILIFVPSIRDYKNRPRLAVTDTGDFPIVQVVGAFVFIPGFAFTISSYFATTTTQLFAVWLAVLQLILQRVISYEGSLLQMITAIVKMLFVMTATTFLLMMPLDSENSLFIGLLTLLVVGLLTETFIWHAISFLDPTKIKKSILQTVASGFCVLMAISLVLTFV